MRKFAPLFALVMALAGQVGIATAAPAIGVYYYPGWSDDPDPMNKMDNWRRIKAFPEREPLLGWYHGSSPATLRQQAAWMTAAHIDYTVFDWYFEGGRVQLNGAMNAYMQLSTPHPKLSVLWANHGGHTTEADWHGIVDAWVGYVERDDYFKIGGANVIFVYDGQRLADDAKAVGANVSDWITYAHARMRARGLPPLYLVAGVYSGDDPIIASAKKLGFASVSSYGIHHRPGDVQDVKGYNNLDAAYRATWQRMVRFAPALKPILPMTSGWDHRPWGAQPARDFSMSTPAQFKAHLTAARGVMVAKNLNAGIICCWNEYGEGSYIEPTKKSGKAYLDAVAGTFGR